MIDDSVDRVTRGSALVAQAESIVQSMGEGTQPVIAIVTEIAQSSREQRDGIEQINVAISQIDSTTQQNAALVEQAAAAAGSLRKQAAALVEVMEHFKTGEPPVITPAPIAPKREGNIIDTPRACC
ncbi:TPA: hypothetical protein ACPWM7_005124 [Pseudomonas aeruginosa]